ncbi:unnamed protein product [Trichobilharzia regenti]|nr:unnamed protein product [Trichobilharzia regenti]
MISFDVSSLFINVPLMETVDFICQEITIRNIDISIFVSTLKELILRCTTNVHFLFNKEYYRQIDGVDMGFPSGPILADFYLAKLENGPLKGVINDLDFCCPYMDDTFLANVCHAYHLLRAKGIPANQIITFMYDDIANNQWNPFPGKVFNDYTHTDYYNGVNIDYSYTVCYSCFFKRIIFYSNILREITTLL